MKFNLFSALSIAAILISGNAHAGPSENLQTCLKVNTTQEDRDLLVKYIYFTISKHPNLTTYSNIPDSERQQNNKDLGKFMTRLMAKQCVNEVRVVYLEGDKTAIPRAFELAFKGIGEQGMLDIMNDPEVKKAGTAFANQINSEEVSRALTDGKR